MTRINELIEWSDCGTEYSMYVKHFFEEDGRVGVTMIFEDITHEKVTEIVIPSRKFPSFLRTITMTPRSGMNI